MAEAIELGGFSIARLRRPAGEHVIEHDRPALALSFLPLPDSEVTLRSLDGIKSVETRRGTHCLMMPGTRVEGRWRSPTDYFMARFEPLALSDLFGDGQPFAASLPNRTADDPAVLTLATLIVHELETGVERGRLYLESLTTALALAAFPRTETPSRSRRADPRLQRALEYLHDNLEADLSIENLAAEACLSRFHFTRLFTAELGRPPYRYVLDRRLEVSRALLARSQYPVAEVARRSGFRSAAHFARLFARETGLSPTAYRQSFGAR